jgi:transcriptional regulator with XRE-family HTH domain
MTANQFRAALDRLKLSQLGAARLFNSNDRTVRRWAIGERGVPPTVAILVKLMLAGKVSATDIEDAQ